MHYFEKLFLLQKIAFLTANPDISLIVISYLEKSEYSLYVTAVKPLFELPSDKLQRIKGLHKLLPDATMCPIQTPMSRKLKLLVDVNTYPHGTEMREIIQYLLDGCVYTLFVVANYSYPLPVFSFEMKDCVNKAEMRREALDHLNRFLSEYFMLLLS